MSRRQGIHSAALDSLLTMSNSTKKLVLLKKKMFWSAGKSNTNVVREVFSGAPTNQALGCAIVPETSGGKFSPPYSNVNNYYKRFRTFIFKANVIL
jgi:hypothetical protein